MKWKRGRANPRLEDRRGQGGGGFSFPGSRSGGGLGFPMPSGGGRKMGLGTILIVVVVFLVLRSCSSGDDGGGGFDIPGLPSGQSQVPGVDDTSARQPAPGESDAQDEGKQFVNFVLTDLDTFWAGQFESAGRLLLPRGLVLFSGAVA